MKILNKFLKIIKGKSDPLKISIIGFGVVGKHTLNTMLKNIISSQGSEEIDYHFVCFDINDKVLKLGSDTYSFLHNRKNIQISLTTDENQMRDSDLFFICVNTDANKDTSALINPLAAVFFSIINQRKKDSKIIMRSTVEVGTCEKIERMIDIKVGNIPERVDPFNLGNKEYPLVYGGDQIILGFLYNNFLFTNFERITTDTKVTEAMKLVENTQRYAILHINNMIHLRLDELGLDTQEVFELCETKPNFVKTTPGFIGGNCIGIDDKYFINARNLLNDKSRPHVRLMKSINDFDKELYNKYFNEIYYVILNDFNKGIFHREIIIYGLSYKKNCSSLSNSTHLRFAKELRRKLVKEFGIKIRFFDENYNSMKKIPSDFIERAEWIILRNDNPILIDSLKERNIILYKLF